MGSLKVMMRALAILTVVALMPTSANAQTAEKARSYIFAIASADMPVAGAALHLAISAAKSGREVTIALLATGIDLARKGASGPQFAPYDADGPTMLRQAIEAGAGVVVCQICLQNQTLTIADMIDGVAKTNAFELLDLMDRSTVLSFGKSDTMSQIVISAAEPAPGEAPSQSVPTADECDPATDVDGCM